MNKPQTINIHGKEYIPVSERVREAHGDHNEGGISITTELIATNDNHIVFKATVATKKGTFTGYSSVDTTSKKLIEQQNPYEVAETSAVGRALGFAGYGIVNGIASADEMRKSSYGTSPTQGVDDIPEVDIDKRDLLQCSNCNTDINQKVYDFSLKKYGKALCFNCQKIQK